LHLHSFHKAYGFPVVFTRAANVYGPGQQLYRIIPRAILSARTGRPLQLHGGGHSRRSFIHIQDVARATLQLAFEAEPGSTWHLSTRESISIRDLVETICELCGAPFDTVVEDSVDRLGKDQSYMLDSTAIRECFGWSDQVRLDTGITETLAWVDSHLEQLKSLPWTYQHKA
jgi:dTDP-glucose 4,6-dehydratase